LVRDTKGRVRSRVCEIGYWLPSMSPEARRSSIMRIFGLCILYALFLETPEARITLGDISLDGLK